MSKDGPILEITEEEARTLGTALENVYFSLAQKFQGQNPEQFFNDVSNLRDRVKDFLSPKTASKEMVKAEIIKRFDESQYVIEKVDEEISTIGVSVGRDFKCPWPLVEQAIRELTLVCFLKRKKGGAA